MYTDSMLTGEKIKCVRKAKGLSQEELALKISYDRTKLSRIEVGKSECPDDIQRAIKEALCIEEMPFTETERESFKDKLYLWCGFMEEQQLDKSKQMQERLSVITFLPIDSELNSLYRLFAIRLLLLQNNNKLAKETLMALEPDLDRFNNEIMYHYYYTKGSLACKHNQNKNGLRFYLRAKELMKGGFKENLPLHYDIATCLSNLGHVLSAIIFLEEALTLYPDNHAALSRSLVESLLAASYIQIGRFSKAKKLLKECLIKAEIDDKQQLLGSIFNNYGYLYRRTKDWNTAIGFFDDALLYLQKESKGYLDALYQKTKCLIELGIFHKCKVLLSEGRDLSKKDKTYSILFESLSLLMSPNKSNLIDYIENVTVPHLKSYSKIAALEYCEFLLEQYEMEGNLQQVLRLESIMMHIYKEVYEEDLL